MTVDLTLSEINALLLVAGSDLATDALEAAKAKLQLALCNADRRNNIESMRPPRRFGGAHARNEGRPASQW